MEASAVFLDRDGVLNKSFVVGGKPYAPRCLAEIELYDGVHRALSELKRSGYLLIVVTNQPDVATGKQLPEQLELTHRWLMGELDLDAILVCPHLTSDECLCRKPKLGMLHQAKKMFDINLRTSFMVGDRWSDIEMGQNAGLKANFYIDHGYNERRPIGTFIEVDSLSTAAKLITSKVGLR